MPTPMIVYAQLAHSVGKIDISKKNAVTAFWVEGFAKLPKRTKDKLRLMLLQNESWPSHNVKIKTCVACHDRAVIAIGRPRIHKDMDEVQHAYCPCPIGQKERTKRSKPVVKSKHGRGSRRRA